MRYCKLILVSEENNNKIYEMTEQNGSFEVKFGRVGQSFQSAKYSISEWDKVYKSKLKKGYVDITPTKEVDTNEIVVDTKVKEFIFHFKKSSSQIVKNSFLNSSSLTLSDVEKIQQLINNARLCLTNDEKNKYLLDIYKTAPRAMHNVKDFLLPNINFAKALEKEQETIDILKSVKLSDSSELVLPGVELSEQYNKEFEYIIEQLNRPYDIFKVNKPSEKEVFDKYLSTQKNKQTRFLVHGTKEISVLPIIIQGLKIRPSGNFSFSGKAYGDGNYFSEVVAKSMNYTSGSKKVLFVFEVHVGNPFVYEGWYKGNEFTLCKSELEKRGFDSTYVKAGNGLLNSEIIVYDEQQCYLHSIIVI